MICKIVVVGFKANQSRSILYRTIELPKSFWEDAKPFCFADLEEWWNKVLLDLIVKKEADFASIRFVKE